MPEIKAEVTQYTFKVGGRLNSHSWIRVEWRGQPPHEPDTDRVWAVVQASQCLNEKGQWEYEPLPSSRTSAFYRRCRFTLDEALSRAAVMAGGGDAPVIPALAVFMAWGSKHRAEWSERGLWPSAEGYADVVCQHRTGGRSSLSYGYYVGGGHDDKPNRKLIREQVDACLRDLTESEEANAE